MKIAEVRAHWLRYPIPEQSQYTSDFGRLRNFDMVLVEIHDTEGRVGYGEAKAGVGSSSFGGALVSLLRDEFAPLLAGQDPRNITRLWDLLYNGTRFGYARSSGRTFPELDRRGSRISALSGDAGHHRQRERERVVRPRQERQKSAQNDDRWRGRDPKDVSPHWNLHRLVANCVP